MYKCCIVLFAAALCRLGIRFLVVVFKKYLTKKPLPKSRFKFCFEQAHSYNTAVWVAVQHIRSVIRNCDKQKNLLVATAYSTALYAIQLPHTAVYFPR